MAWLYITSQLIWILDCWKKYKNFKYSLNFFFVSVSNMNLIKNGSMLFYVNISLSIIKDSWPHVIFALYVYILQSLTLVIHWCTLSYSSTHFDLNSSPNILCILHTYNCLNIYAFIFLTKKKHICIYLGSHPFYLSIHPDDQFPWTITSIYNVNLKKKTFDQRTSTLGWHCQRLGRSFDYR